MKRLRITHYLQDPCGCAIAASASAANYYNEDVDYNSAKVLTQKKIAKNVLDEGLDTAEICMLLNRLGFYKVTWVTSNLNIFDYKWAHFRRKRMIETLEDSITSKKDKMDKANTRLVLKWLKNYDFDNNVIISYDFRQYIQQHLNRKKPVLLSFNWTMFQRFSKEGKDGPDPINGEEEEHEVLINGYDNKGVWIVDSHHEYYKYKRKKYRRGFYKISWENLLTCMGTGDVILPEEYCIEQ